jgi:hypothetical protein
VSEVQNGLKINIMSSLSATEELVLDVILVGPDQVTDCTQVFIHTILVYRSIDVPTAPQSFHLPGVDIAYASAETAESTQ